MFFQKTYICINYARKYFRKQMFVIPMSSVNHSNTFFLLFDLAILWYLFTLKIRQNLWLKVNTMQYFLYINSLKCMLLLNLVFYIGCLYLNWWIIGSWSECRIKSPTQPFLRRLNLKYYEVASKYWAYFILLNLTTGGPLSLIGHFEDLLP